MLWELYTNERGQAAALAAAVILMLIALTGLVVDGCLLIYNKVRLEAATEAAAHATFLAYDRELWENEGIVELDPYWAKHYATKLLNQNFPKAVLQSCEVGPVAKNTAIVKTSVEVELIFMKAFGIEKKTVRATIKNKVG